jgi:GTP cyclohydrolase I
MVEEQRIQMAVAEIIEAIGEDASREGLTDTPQRVARLYTELFAGIGVDPRSAINTVFDEEVLQEEMVFMRNVPFFSVCEHHLLPFFGHAHMGYIPDGKVAGASKLVRALEVVSKRPQLQERLTNQLADAIQDVLQPDGVVVMVEAEHLCMAMRGVKKTGSTIVTSASRGRFEKCGISRTEFLNLLHRG